MEGCKLLVISLALLINVSEQRRINLRENELELDRVQFGNDAVVHKQEDAEDEPPRLKERSDEPPRLKERSDEPPRLKERSDEPPKFGQRSDEPPRLKERSDEPPRLKNVKMSQQD